MVHVTAAQGLTCNWHLSRPEDLNPVSPCSSVTLLFFTGGGGRVELTHISVLYVDFQYFEIRYFDIPQMTQSVLVQMRTVFCPAKPAGEKQLAGNHQNYLKRPGHTAIHLRNLSELLSH